MIYATDIVAFTDLPDGELAVLLILRAEDSDAFPKCWSLPGGLVEDDETSLSAAARELREETGLDLPITWLRRIDVYDTPRRDPRGRVVSTAYAARVSRPVEVKGGDDAAEAEWVPVREAFGRKLAFDHAEILSDELKLNGLGHLAP